MPIRNAQSRPVAQPPTVSPRWLLTAVWIVVLAAALCAWGTLCLLFWQGSWQLLYHPSTAIAHTPADAGLAFDPVGFAASETGQPRIWGWWIPAAPASPLNGLTILCLHGATGNLGDTVDAVAQLHALGVNVLAFDYRGYGQSQFAHPSEAHWIEDANWALEYLTQIRHLDPHTIVLAGNQLGANLAIEVAAAHPGLAGAIVQTPTEDPTSAIFNDSRARLVPAHLLVRDRYDISAAAATLRIPSVWFTSAQKAAPQAYLRAKGPKQLVGLNLAQSVPPRDVLVTWLTKLQQNQRR